jgi:hypothetical protein
MGELESLLLILALIYLSECLVWLRRGALAFQTWWGRDFRVVHPGSLLSNQRGGLALANPLPPLGTVFVCQLFPLSISPEGVFGYSTACLDDAGRPFQTAAYVRLDDIREIAVNGRKLLVNGEIFLHAISTFSARHIAEQLRRLSKLPGAERAGAIKRFIRDSLNDDDVSKLLRECRSRSLLLRVLSNALFFYLFVVLVPLVWRFGFGQFGAWLLAGMLAQTISIAILFRRAHAALHPGADEERFKPFLTMLLAPPTAIRAPDILARHVFENFHPLALARALCPREPFRELARQVLLDSHYPLFPISPKSDPAAVAAEQWFRDAALNAVEKYVAGAGLQPRDLIAPPKPAEPSSRSYCARCGAQFVMTEGTCADCGGRPLEPFAEKGPA